jgi:hypothetical protein
MRWLTVNKSICSGCGRINTGDAGRPPAMLLTEQAQSQRGSSRKIKISPTVLWRTSQASLCNSNSMYKLKKESANMACLKNAISEPVSTFLPYGLPLSAMRSVWSDRFFKSIYIFFFVLGFNFRHHSNSHLIITHWLFVPHTGLSGYICGESPTKQFPSECQSSSDLPSSQSARSIAASISFGPRPGIRRARHSVRLVGGDPGSGCWSISWSFLCAGSVQLVCSIVMVHVRSVAVRSVAVMVLHGAVRLIGCWPGSGLVPSSSRRLFQAKERTTSACEFIRSDTVSCTSTLRVRVQFATPNEGLHPASFVKRSLGKRWTMARVPMPA